MSDKPADATPPPPAKSKKLLLVVGVLVLLLVAVAAGGWFYVSKQRAALEAGDEPAVAKVEAKGPPVYLPLDNLVVNLADPGGEKVAQVGITFELSDSRVVEKVKQYLPTIRSGVLLLISQRTAEELLQREGKEKLQRDILREALRPFGFADPALEAAASVPVAGTKKAKPAKKEKETAHDEPPVRGVLFSSFIVQ